MPLTSFLELLETVHHADFSSTEGLMSRYYKQFLSFPWTVNFTNTVLLSSVNAGPLRLKLVSFGSLPEHIVVVFRVYCKKYLLGLAFS